MKQKYVTYGLFAVFAVLALCMACFGCATSARQSLVDQKSEYAQKLADVLGEAQATTLDGAQKFFEAKKAHQVTDVAKWQSEAQAHGTFETPANQFFYAQLQLGIKSTENKLALIAALKAEAAKVPTGTVAPLDASK